METARPVRGAGQGDVPAESWHRALVRPHLADQPDEIRRRAPDLFVDVVCAFFWNLRWPPASHRQLAITSIPHVHVFVGQTWGASARAPGSTDEP